MNWHPLLLVQENADKFAYKNRQAEADKTLRLAVVEAIALIRAGCPGEAEYTLRRAESKAHRILGAGAS